MAAKDKSLLRISAYNIQKKQRLESRIEAGTATMFERGMHDLNKRFGNTYLQMIDPDAPLGVRAAYINKMADVIKGKEINRHLKNLPDDKYGPQIAKYLRDPTEISKLPLSVRPWAQRLGSDLRTLQSQARKEGFISEEEFANVGETWFSTVRKGTPQPHEGPTTTVFQRARGGKTEMIQIPRTQSFHFLQRKTSKADLDMLINRQAAAEALKRGKSQEALKLLKNDEEIATLIANGDEASALGALTADGAIDLTPQALTTRSLLQQKLLMENYRYIRDLALNPDVTKNIDDIAKLSKSAQKNWVNMDDVLPNANRVRRMVARKIGEDGEAPLGFIHKSIFREMTDLETGFMGQGGGMLDMLTLLTAVHKTAKTAFNVPTHFQNLLGNYVFMMNAGFNPFSANAFDLLYKKALPAVWKAQQATRKGKSVENLGKLGSVKSRVGGKTIEIGEELGSFEVGELIERSSLMASEGVGILERMAKRSKDHGALTELMLKGFQKTLGAPGMAHASDMYMAEDAFAKFGFFLDLRARGFNRAAAAIEVARRMPMYHTLGPAPAQLRKAVLPWISFPAEAARVLKNNLTDFPLRTAGMLHAVNGVQALMYPFTGESYEGLQEQKEQQPMWAQTPMSTVMTPFKDDNDDIRSAVLDFMPHAAFLPNTVAKDAPLRQKLPFGADQPFPILMGLVDALTGKGSFGQDIPTDPEHPLIDGGTKALFNTISFVSPPILQKYLFNTNTPTSTYRLMQDFGDTVNPATMKPGVRMFDMFVNNASAIKMYPSSPEQKISNESMSLKALRNYRGKLTTNWNAWVRSTDWVSAGDTLRDVMQTYNQEYGEPGMAQAMFNDWLKRHARDIVKHPQLRGMSKEDIIAKLVEQGPELSMARTSAQAKYIQSLRQEVVQRGLGAATGRSRQGRYGRPARKSLGR
jgi:hypothetical protein